MTDKKEFSFTSEVSRLLEIVIHSLYSNRDIVLRELISNASDALDRLRFAALTEAGTASEDELAIHIDFDEAKHTLTIRDNGIGMSEQEVIENIGTIARSGTKRFLESLDAAQRSDAKQIGQFGVGFYSAFIIAEKVYVRTRRADSNTAIEWQSTGTGTYTIAETTKADNGTEVILHLKKEAKDFTDGFFVRNIVKTYSDHISFPIYLPKVADDEKKDEKGKDTKQASEAHIITVPEYERVNSAEAFWQRAKKDITDEEYKDFYKQSTHDFKPPLAWQHNRVEGKHEYTALLYIPTQPPFDLWERKRHSGIKLYVQRVFILEDTEKLLPNYLRFVRGLIDSNDLPLNVSREMLQGSRIIDTLKSACTKRILSLLNNLADKKPDTYTEFWRTFGEVFKEGLVEDFENKDTILSLLRARSTHTKDDEVTSFAEYKARMKTGQKDIYYLTAESHTVALGSPHLEAFRARDIEVLLLSDRIDEWVSAQFGEFEGCKFIPVSRGTVDLTDIGTPQKEEKDTPSIKASERTFQSVLKAARTHLTDRVKNVRLTDKLTESPARLVADEQAMGLHMQRIMQQMGQKAPEEKPILELNPHHPVLQKLHDETDASRVHEWLDVLFDQAMLSEGMQLKDPTAFVGRLNRLLLSFGNATPVPEQATHTKETARKKTKKSSAEQAD